MAFGDKFGNDYFRSTPLGGTRGLLKREIRRNEDDPQLAREYKRKLSDMNIAMGMRGEGLIGSSESNAKEITARRNMQMQQLGQGAGVATGSYEAATGDRLIERKKIDAGIQGLAQKGELTGERLSEARRSAAGAGVSNDQFNAYLYREGIKATSPEVAANLGRINMSPKQPDYKTPMAPAGNEIRVSDGRTFVTADKKGVTPPGVSGKELQRMDLRDLKTAIGTATNSPNPVGATGSTGAPGVPGDTASSDDVAVGVPATPASPNKLERSEEIPPEKAPYNPRPGYSGDIRGEDGRPLTIPEQIAKTDVRDVLNRSDDPDNWRGQYKSKADRDARFKANFEDPASGRTPAVAARAEEAAEAAEEVNVRDTLDRNAAAIKEMGESMQQYRDSNVGRKPLETLSPEEYRRQLFSPRPEEEGEGAGPPSLIGGIPAAQSIARSRQRVANRQALSRGEIPDLNAQDGETGYADDVAKALRGQFYQDFEEKYGREAMLDALLERRGARNEARAEQLGLSVADYNKGIAEEARSIEARSTSEPDFTDEAKALRKEKIISRNKQRIKESKIKDYVDRSVQKLNAPVPIDSGYVPDSTSSRRLLRPVIKDIEAEEAARKERRSKSFLL